VDAILRITRKKIGILGLSFKAGTDDLRESPQVELIKRLLGEGCRIQIWDEYVSMGRLIGSNLQFIEEVIPHIDSLISSDLQQVIQEADVVVIGTRSVDRDTLAGYLRAEQIVIDLANLERSRRTEWAARYEGICW